MTTERGHGSCERQTTQRDRRPETRSANRRARRQFFPVAAALLFLPIVLGFFHGYWLSDLAAQLRIHLALLLLAVVPFLLWQRSLGTGCLSAAAAIGVIGLTLPAGHPTVDPGGRTIYKALQFNIHEFNTRMPALIDLLDAERPDFVALSEYTGDWHAVVEADLANRYPFRWIEPRRDLVGLAVLSRYPIESTRLFDVPGSARPILVAEIRVPEGQLILVNVHAESPRTAQRFASRNAAIQRVATIAASSREGALVALGDFNMTPWAGNFSLLRDRGRLTRPAGARWRIHATWPSRFGPAGVAIDHILLSPELEGIDYRIGPNAGSDHLPVICEFVFRIRD